MDDGGAVLDLNDFFYFVQVVDRGGFTAGAGHYEFRNRH
jgi:hypothetical protein